MLDENEKRVQKRKKQIEAEIERNGNGGGRKSVVQREDERVRWRDG